MRCCEVNPIVTCTLHNLRSGCWVLHETNARECRVYGVTTECTTKSIQIQVILRGSLLEEVACEISQARPVEFGLLPRQTNSQFHPSGRANQPATTNKILFVGLQWRASASLPVTSACSLPSPAASSWACFSWCCCFCC